MEWFLTLERGRRATSGQGKRARKGRAMARGHSERAPRGNGVARPSSRTRPLMPPGPTQTEAGPEEKWRKINTRTRRPRVYGAFPSGSRTVGATRPWPVRTGSELRCMRTGKGTGQRARPRGRTGNGAACPRP